VPAGQVLAHDPLLLHELRVEGHDHDAVAGDTRELSEAGRNVVPALEGEDRHRGVKRVLLERHLLGDDLDGRCRARRALRDPLGQRLDRVDVEVARLV
jgi:hypothetical protein